jgi:hypothetical protein
MKRILSTLFLVLTLGLGFLTTARAQELPVYASPETKIALTPPEDVAMVFYKLSRKEPDLESWARQTEAYKAAAAFDQSVVLEQEVQKLREAYNLLALQEPLVVATPVKISAYSKSGRGFFVENFRTDTFFPFFFGGAGYAVVPQSIMDKQWLKVEDANTVAAIEAAAKESPDHMLRMVLQLSPVSADAASSVNIDGADYWLIAASVKKMTLYPMGDGQVLWQSDDAGVNNTQRQDLLNLYQ